MNGKSTPVARVSRVKFYTDMARLSAPAVPLGVYVEVVWPKVGRWFGVIGREHVSDAESRVLDTKAFPELTSPWQFLSREFEEAWTQPAGESCTQLARKYQWALNVSPPEKVDVVHLLPNDKVIENFAKALTDLLFSFEGELVPVAPTDVSVQMPAQKSVPVRIETAKQLEAA